MPGEGVFPSRVSSVSQEEATGRCASSRSGTEKTRLCLSTWVPSHRVLTLNQVLLSFSKFNACMSVASLHGAFQNKCLTNLGANQSLKTEVCSL